MAVHLAKLVSVASEGLAHQPPRWNSQSVEMDPAGVRELSSLLSARNGFYAFESALHVFPAAADAQTDIGRWNAPSLWRCTYRDLAEGCLFFAEDIFGVQFCFFEGNIWTFDPETGAKDFVAANLSDWAGLVLSDYEMLTGYPLARDWQATHGPIAPGRRLVPKIPFVLGGEYDLENLHALDAVRGMRLRGELAIQIRDLPDGASVAYEVTD